MAGGKCHLHRPNNIRKLFIIYKIYYITISGRGHHDSHAIELTLFLWHMPDDATEGVAKHSSRLQPSINLHAPVTVQYIGPTQDSNPGDRIQNHKQ